MAEEVEIGEEGLQQLQQEVDQLQENFDKAVIEKHSLAHTCQQLAEKLKAANHLLERYTVLGMSHLYRCLYLDRQWFYNTHSLLSIIILVGDTDRCL